VLIGAVLVVHVILC